MTVIINGSFRSIVFCLCLFFLINLLKSSEIGRGKCWHSVPHAFLPLFLLLERYHFFVPKMRKLNSVQGQVRVQKWIVFLACLQLR